MTNYTCLDGSDAAGDFELRIGVTDGGRVIAHRRRDDYIGWESLYVQELWEGEALFGATVAHFSVGDSIVRRVKTVPGSASRRIGDEWWELVSVMPAAEGRPG